jgi:hypothetical protein
MAGATLSLALVALADRVADSEPAHGLGRWDTLAHGHHRAVVRVEGPADAVVTDCAQGPPVLVVHPRSGDP